MGNLVIWVIWSFKSSSIKRVGLDRICLFSDPVFVAHLC